MDYARDLGKPGGRPQKREAFWWAPGVAVVLTLLASASILVLFGSSGVPAPPPGFTGVKVCTYGFVAPRGGPDCHQALVKTPRAWKQ